MNNFHEITEKLSSAHLSSWAAGGTGLVLLLAAVKAGKGLLKLVLVILARRNLVAGLLAFCCILWAGCQSARQAGSVSHAAVQIQGSRLADIQPTTTAVFGEEGYNLAAATAYEMVFERPGTRRDALKWGGWSGNGVTMRVKVALSKLTDGNYLVEADAYAVQNSDDPFFQTESRNILLDRRPYQKLLDEVAIRLK